MKRRGDNQAVGGMIVGKTASPGLARGRALMCECVRETVVHRRQVNEKEAPAEIARFDEAVDVVERTLEGVRADLRETLGNAEAEIFGAQILMLREVELRDMVHKLCLVEQMNVEAAVEQAIQRLMAAFEQLEDSYFRERATDLNEVGKRLLDHLTSNTQSPIPPDTEDCVLITKEVFSATVAQLEGRGVKGLVVEGGGGTAHAAILARALGIPMLVQVPEATKRISTGDFLIIDALAGRVFMNPNAQIVQRYEQLDADLRAHQNVLQELVDLPSVTRDGVLVNLSANIGQLGDAAAASLVKPDGAGLYRTEFMFFVQDRFPSEEEQYQFYRDTAEQLLPGRTVIRVLDIGSDKPLAYFPMARETNPALGCRGTRLLLTYPAILRTQLRAILRVSATHPVSILLPMIREVDELRAVKEVIEEMKRELTAANLPFDPEVPVGAMIETPAAAVLLNQLAEEVSFFSVGTNDLVQYLLAADRAASEVTTAYDSLHPAVIQVLASIASMMDKPRGRPVSVCGEIASDPLYTAVLLGLGFHHLSVSPGRLLEIKYAIRSINFAEAKKLARNLLSLSSSHDIHTRVEEEWKRRQPVSSPELSTL